MATPIKQQRAILNKLNITSLNQMQEEAHVAISTFDNVVLLSPTGTGKTLAFLLPLVENIDSNLKEVQVLILAPSRELALQIEQVAQAMGAGVKINAIYGGRAGAKDKLDLQQAPALLIGTPGRIADHIRRRSFSTKHLNTLVLDEFDKSLEIGFEDEMKDIVRGLPYLQRRILTSATKAHTLPDFLGMKQPTEVNYLDELNQQLSINCVQATEKDKLSTLTSLLQSLPNENGLIFCNFKNTIQWLSDYLNTQDIPHGCFYGGMEQNDRERALVKFRNGTYQILLATDLAARGLDIPALNFIIHFQLPPRAAEFTHRNGRTARMHQEGAAYVLFAPDEKLPAFIKGRELIPTPSTTPIAATPWRTILISAGKRDKISKGDIAGFLIKTGGVTPKQVGIIEIKSDCAFVAVDKNITDKLLPKVTNQRIKKRKVRVYEV